MTDTKHLDIILQHATPITLANMIVDLEEHSRIQESLKDEYDRTQTVKRLYSLLRNNIGHTQANDLVYKVGKNKAEW